MNTDVPIHVVKIGGSLLELPDLGPRLCGWFDEQRQLNSAAHFVVVVGGGKLVDALRDLDERHHFDDEFTHWLAIDLMAVNTRVMHQLWPEATRVETWDELNKRIRLPGLTLFTATQFLREVEPAKAGRWLPANWSVTSDSIAGRLAIVLRAKRLVLLKWGIALNAGDRNERAYERTIPYVDVFFQSLWPELPPAELVGFSTDENFSGISGVASGDQRATAKL